MKVLSSSIFLKNLRFHAFHGVMPQERIVGNDYLVDVHVNYDFSHAMATDELDDTINYAEVYQLVKEEMNLPSKLLEHLAGRIGKRLIDSYPSIQDVSVSVMKQNPPFEADSDGAGVQVHLMNHKTL